MANVYLDALQQKGGQQGQGADLTSLLSSLSPNESSAPAPTTDAQGNPIQQTDVTQPGQGADQTTRPLTQAISALEAFTMASSDRGEIATIKTIIQLLAGIMQRNQRSAVERIQTQGQQS